MIEDGFEDDSEKCLIFHDAFEDINPQFLDSEILQGGNFGQYDQRVNHRVGQYQKNIQRLKRDFRLVRYFPSECLWEPVFRIYHFFWRLKYN